MSGERREHSPEPWTFEDRLFEDDRFYARAADDYWVTGIYADDRGGRDEANAHRIVACVNACAGLPTAALEAGHLARALEGLAFVLRMLDSDQPMTVPEALAAMPKVEGYAAALRALRGEPGDAP